MTDKDTQSTLPQKKNVLWVYLSGAMALTIVSLLFLPGSGMGSEIISIYSVMLWCGIFGACFARYRDNSGWMGFAIGSGVGVVLQLVSQFI